MAAGLASPSDVKGKEVVIFYGLGFANPQLASKINKYVFSLNQKLFTRLLVVAFRGQKLGGWIKKPKEVSDEITAYCKEYGLQRTPMLEKLIADDYYQFLTETRADDKAFTKAGFVLERPEKNVWF